MKDLMFGAICLVFACALLGLRQFVLRGRKSGRAFFMRLDGDSDGPGADDRFDEWPSVIAVSDKPSPADVDFKRDARRHSASLSGKAGPPRPL